MRAIKKTVSISEDLVKEANTIAPNFSAIVEAALIEYFQHHRLQKAIASFGKWENREESSVDFVNKLRHEDDRKYADRTDRH